MTDPHAAVDASTAHEARTYVFPASFSQQRLWVIERLAGERSAYNEARLVRLVGPLDATALGEAFNALIERHESLRTRLVSVDGVLQQEVIEWLDFKLPFADFLDNATEQRVPLARAAARDEAARAFDLQVAPLFRAQLWRVSPSEHLLLVVLHHIITDGWSTQLFWRDLAAFYRSRTSGGEPQLPALPIQYADYAVWQRQWLSGERLAQEVGYWRQALEGMPVLELPADRLRPAVASYRGARVGFELAASLTGQLRALARRERATLFMVLMAGFEVLLSRYSGQDDFGVGVPVAGRMRPELEGLIGFFANTLVMRAQLHGQASFREQLGRVRESSLRAFENQELPFEKLVEELNPPRDLSRNPLFQVSFALQNVPRGAPDFGTLQAARIDLEAGVEKFDLSLVVFEEGDGLRCHFDYATDLFDRERIDRMAGHYRTLLEAAVADPGCSVARLPILTAEEHRQLLVQWNDTAREYPRGKCVHRLVEEQVWRSPEAVALVYGAQQLTYREFNARANQLAHYLRGMGVSPGSLVGVYLERSPELVMALLGILKAGAAYVPLDTAWPMERLAFSLRDTGLRLVVTQQALKQPLLAGGVEAICLDTEWPSIAMAPGEDLPDGVPGSDSLAYVIFTSGSTGQPKGVMVEHRAVVNYLAWIAGALPLAPHDRMLHKTPVTFDASVEEIFFPLMQGAALVISGPEAHRSVQDLITLVRRHSISVLQVVPSLLSAMVGSSGFASCSSLRLILCGAEPLSSDLVGRVRQVTKAELVNLYGPTETTISSTYWRCDAGAPAHVVPIGRPIANTRLYVLDANRQPVPVGVAGELYIGGEGLARGYWNRPELTAERFVRDPFSAAHESRLYRTGDRVRYRSGGEVEFLGRLDHQVKLRGFRIELGEIEAALMQQPYVREAAVSLREDAAGAPRLVAYVVIEGEGVGSAQLRAALRHRLPDYMLPAAFVHLPKLPVTASGKVDRKGLPAPDDCDEMAGEGDDAQPQDAIQVQLMRIWERALDRYPVGISEDFFDIGGHSLLAVHVVDRINRLFDRELPIDVLWHGGRTIEALAELLRQRESAARPLWSQAVPFRANGSRPPVFCPPVVGGHLYYYDNLARYLSPEQPVYGLPAQGTDSHDPPHSSVQAMASYAIRLMREVQPRGPYHLLGYCSGGVVAFEMARQLEVSNEIVARLILIDSIAPHWGPGAWGKQVFSAARSRDLRLLQERLYHLLLQPVGLEGLRRLQKLGEAHRWALWSYRPRPFGGRMVLIRPVELQHARDPFLGWRRFARGGVELRVLPGVHGSLVTVRGAAQLADEISRLLQ